MKAKMLASLRGLLLVAPITLALPAVSGCGTSLEDYDNAFEQLWDDLEDAEDFEDFGEAWDDFFEELDD